MKLEWATGPLDVPKASGVLRRTLPRYIISLFVMGAGVLPSRRHTLPSKLYRSKFGSSTTTSALIFRRASGVQHLPMRMVGGCLFFRLVSPSRAIVSMYAVLLAPLLSSKSISAGQGSSRRSRTMSPTRRDCHWMDCQTSEAAAVATDAFFRSPSTLSDAPGTRRTFASRVFSSLSSACLLKSS